MPMASIVLQDSRFFTRCRGVVVAVAIATQPDGESTCCCCLPCIWVTLEEGGEEDDEVMFGVGLHVFLVKFLLLLEVATDG